MNKKLIFLDLDGTIISHKTNSIPESTLLAIKLLQEKGHIVCIATGRTPCLFNGIEKKLNIDSYVASNGRIVVYNGERIFDKAINRTVVEEVVRMAENEGLDIAFESDKHYVLQSEKTHLPKKFSDVFHLDYPEVWKDYHIGRDIYQMVLFYDKADYKRFEIDFPSLVFSYSNEFGLDVNEVGGLKDFGVKEMIKYLGFDKEDTIAVGDGFNDISMLEYCNVGIAMGNAHSDVKEVADIVTDNVENDGLIKAFRGLNMI